MTKKIGILTWHYYGNFGSGLQAFALQQLLLDLGYDVSIINYRNPDIDYHVWWKDVIKYLLHNTIGFCNKKIYSYTSQAAKKYQARYLRQTERFSEPQYLANAVKDYFCMIYGSDQIWAPNAYNPIYMGAYVPSGIRKISYAASVGLNFIPDNLLKEYTDNLSSFHSVSVRENEGKSLLKNCCGIDAEVVLDPTLMINADVYRNMLKPVDNIKGKFVYCYFLNKEHKYRKTVEDYAHKHNLQIIGSSDKDSDSEWMNRLINIGADQFLWLINNAEAVFTDSYHGSIFSLLFHKNFWTFVRFDESSPICQNSRIRQLQSHFNIQHRIISNKECIDDPISIDFEDFEKHLVELRAKSTAYLKEALK